MQDVRVLNKVNVGSDHRMVMGEIEINTRLERQKLIRPKHSNINLEKLSARRADFQLELHNRFLVLNDEWTENNPDIDDWNDQFIDTVQDCTLKIAGKKPKENNNKLSDETKKLLNKRREMKMDNTGISHIEYTETCKTIREKDKRRHQEL